MEASPKVVSRKELENCLWGEMPPDSDVLRSHMYTLRKKIDKPFDHAMIETVHGVGFRLRRAEP
jgi:DNA-binding response OmpR family regulator